MSFELSLRIISTYGLPLFDHNVISQNFLLPAPADISLIIIASYYYTCEKNVAEFTFATSKLRAQTAFIVYLQKWIFLNIE